METIAVLSQVTNNKTEKKGQNTRLSQEFLPTILIDSVSVKVLFEGSTLLQVKCEVISRFPKRDQYVLKKMLIAATYFFFLIGHFTLSSSISISRFEAYCESSHFLKTERQSSGTKICVSLHSTSKTVGLSILQLCCIFHNENFKFCTHKKKADLFLLVGFASCACVLRKKEKLMKQFSYHQNMNMWFSHQREKKNICFPSTQFFSS